MIIFEDGLIYITYQYRVKNKNKTERFVAAPIFLQFHPQSGEEVIYKVHFDEIMPSWMTSYAKNIGWVALELNGGRQSGFVLANKTKTVSANPLFRGIIMDWFEEAHESFLPFRDRLLMNLECVEQNLIQRQGEFRKMELYYRLEEFEGKYGALHFSQYSHSPNTEFFNLDLSTQNNWHRLIDELTADIEIPEQTIITSVTHMVTPVEAVSEVDEIEAIDVETNVSVDEIVIVAIDVETNVSVDEIVIEAIDVETNVSVDEIVIEVIDVETSVSVDEIVIDTINVEATVLEAVDVETDVPVDVIVSEAVVEPIISVNDIGLVTVEANISTTTKLKIASKRNRKDGIIEGQILLF